MSYSLEELEKKLGTRSIPTTQNFLTETKKKKEVVENNPNLSNLERILKDKKMLEERKEQLMAMKLVDSKKEIAEVVSDIVFFFDRSGSCEGTEKATIASFNNLIETEKSKKYETYVSVVLFNHKSKEVFERVPISEFKSLKYKSSNATLLYDTLCEYLKKYKNMTPSSGKKLAVIMTDGMDTSSRDYNLSKTCDIIKECKKVGWEFIFLGAKIDSLEMALKLGIDYSADYILDDAGISAGFKAIEAALGNLRVSGNIGSSWKKPLQDNLKSIESKDSEPVLRLGVK